MTRKWSVASLASLVTADVINRVTQAVRDTPEGEDIEITQVIEIVIVPVSSDHPTEDDISAFKKDMDDIRRDLKAIKCPDLTDVQIIDGIEIVTNHANDPSLSINVEFLAESLNWGRAAGLTNREIAKAMTVFIHTCVRWVSEHSKEDGNASTEDVKGTSH
jgi:hypothetical protein